MPGGSVELSTAPPAVDETEEEVVAPVPPRLTGRRLLSYLLGLCASCLPSIMSKKKSATGATSTLNGARITKRMRRETWPVITPPEGAAADEQEEVGPAGARRRSQRLRPQSACEQDLYSIPLADEFSPFTLLPEDCKLKIFAFLTPFERGRCSSVCSEWARLVQTPSLWTNIDLTIFPVCANLVDHKCSATCYSAYKKRLKQYMTYLGHIHPAIHQFHFALDINDPKDKWLVALESLLVASHCQDLEVAQLNWKETPMKTPYHCPQEGYGDYMHRLRHRQRRFVTFFDQFTTHAIRVRSLKLPFDWSVRSLECLVRLKWLQVLVLERYFRFQALPQNVLDELFAGIPSLRRLVLEVWTPSGRGLQLYKVNSKNLFYFDISQCRGFYLGELNTPALEVFKVARHPWTGPLSSTDNGNFPCLYDILISGCKQLRQLNEHTLRQNWQVEVYDELETVLQAVCSCRKHRKGWVM